MFCLDSYLAQNSWKVHEEFGLMIGDLNRELPNPQHKRSQDYWQLHRVVQRPFARRKANPFDEDDQSFQRISVANGIFVQNGFSIRSDYKDAIESTYKSTLQRLDFINKSQLSTKYINR